METKFESSRGILYDVFSIYNIKGNLRGRSCECCVSDEEIRLLLSKPLGQLTENELGHFMRSAVSTFGDVEDYKHFLPRILELLYYPNEYFLEDFLIFEKLNYSEWETWSSKEIEAIENYFEALLIKIIDDSTYDIDRIIDTINLVFKYTSIDNLISILEKSNFSKLINFIVDSTLNGIDKSLHENLKIWFRSIEVLKKIEKTFFQVEDKDLAARISIVYTILENH